MKKSALRECEAIAFNAITISSVLCSIVIIAYFIMTDAVPMAYLAHTINIVICSLLFYRYKKTNQKYRFHVILMLFHFSFNFAGVWFVFSYHHPMVLLFLVLIIIGNMLLLKQKHLKVLIPIETVMVIGFLMYDYQIRSQVNYSDSLSIGKFLGIIIILITIAWIIYKFKVVINDKVNTLEEYSFVDPLTKAKNSRAFADDYLTVMTIWDKDKRPFALVNIDINDFKNINDTYGHQVGDDVLIELVAKIKEASVKDENVYRIGGDEFVVLLKGKNRTEASQFINRLTDQHKLSFEYSISYGIADSYEMIKNEELLSLADKRMYETKHIRKKALEITNSYCGQVIFK